jgi:hypothetical protein
MVGNRKPHGTATWNSLCTYRYPDPFKGVHGSSAKHETISEIRYVDVRDSIPNVPAWPSNMISVGDISLQDWRSRAPTGGNTLNTQSRLHFLSLGFPLFWFT